MPRKLRNPKTRVGQQPVVSEALYVLLVWGDWRAATAQQEHDGSDAWELFDNGAHVTAWKAIETRALRDWSAAHPGTRPSSWWWWSAPELRRIHGRFRVMSGIGRCQATGIPFGEPIDWDDLPMVESEAGYLDRLGLFLDDAERARVPILAFDPRRFSWDLMHSPNGGAER